MEKRPIDISVKSISKHKNGTCKEFHVVLFFYSGLNMQAIVFAEPGNISVLNSDKVKTGEIDTWSLNSWKGEMFEDTLRKCIETWHVV